jgi:hypothetical protein
MLSQKGGFHTHRLKHQYIHTQASNSSLLTLPRIAKDCQGLPRLDRYLLETSKKYCTTLTTGPLVVPSNNAGDMMEDTLLGSNDLVRWSNEDTHNTKYSKLR